MTNPRKITAKAMTGAMSNCVQITTTTGGRKTKWVACATGHVGTVGGGWLSVGRGGRRGGIRGEGRHSGGITACSSRGEKSKCVRAPYGVTLFPGGGTSLRKKGIPVMDGIKRKRRRSRKGRR